MIDLIVLEANNQWYNSFFTCHSICIIIYDNISILKNHSIMVSYSFLTYPNTNMPQNQCIHVVFQDPSLVVRASHECLGLLLRDDIESLVVDAFKAVFDHCISLLLCLNNTLVQIDVLYAHSLTIDHDVARCSLCCVVHHMLLIDKTVHLRAQSHEPRDAMPVMLILEDGSRQLLVEVEERFQWRELALVHFMLVVVHELSIEVARVIQFWEVKRLVHVTHLVNDVSMSLRYTHQLVRHHSMHGSTIQVVGVQVVNAFTACRCLLCVVNVDLGMSFHDLCDASSQVLQQSHEWSHRSHLFPSIECPCSHRTRPYDSWTLSRVVSRRVPHSR